jgi:hypothetical protein
MIKDRTKIKHYISFNISTNINYNLVHSIDRAKQIFAKNLEIEIESRNGDRKLMLINFK